MRLSLKQLFAKRTTPQEDSPCRSICALDPDVRLCRGCGRAPAEITGWNRLSWSERQKILSELPERLRSLPTDDLPPASAPSADRPANS